MMSPMNTVGRSSTRLQGPSLGKVLPTLSALRTEKSLLTIPQLAVDRPRCGLDELEPGTGIHLIAF